MNDLKINGLNKYWSVRFLVLSFLFIGCVSLVNVAYVQSQNQAAFISDTSLLLEFELS